MSRFVFFGNGNPVSANLSQADVNIEFSATRGGDIYGIEAGDERYEIVELIFSMGSSKRLGRAFPIAQTWTLASPGC